MRLRTYLILLIIVVALGAFTLVGGLNYAFQNLEREREHQIQSSKAVDRLAYVKEDIGRLTVLGDLIFGSNQGLNSYLAQPALSQLLQIKDKLNELSQYITLNAEQIEEFNQDIENLQSLFSSIHKGKAPEDAYDQYDQRSFKVISSFRSLFKSSQALASRDSRNLEKQKNNLNTLAWILSLAYLSLIILLTWWSNRSISKPVVSLSQSATKALDDTTPFPLNTSGPVEFKSLAAILYRLINQLETEVSKKTIDLEQENKERRAAETQLRILNERQKALVEASVRFVPRPFLEFLGRSDLTLVERGDSIRQHLGILFSDLRGFTSLAETREAQEIFDLLNRYLDTVVPAIHNNYGFVDKYIGDAIMALFPNQAERAVQAGIDMFHELYAFVEKTKVPLKMGIGIHWGEVVLGTLGSKERWESTVIGDTVNLAARLEGMTKAYDCPLIISEALVNALPETHTFDLRPLDLVRVKGRSTPVTIYEVINAHPVEEQSGRISSLELSLNGFECYRRGEFTEAIKIFSTMKKQNAYDPLPNIFLKRCKELAQSRLDPEWSGVYNHTSK